MNTAINQNTPNFALKAFYDLDLGEINRQSFNEDEDFYVKEFFSRRGDLNLVVVSEKPLDSCAYSKSKLKRLKKLDLMVECAKYESALGMTDSLTDIKGYYDHYGYTKDELVDQLLNVSIEKYHSAIHENTSWHDLEKDFTVTGYCQGDVFKVVLVGKIPSFVNSEYLEHIYYGTPFTVRLEDEESGDIIVDLADSVSDYSGYEREVALSSFEQLLKDHAQKDQAMEYLREKLPKALDYQ